MKDFFEENNLEKEKKELLEDLEILASLSRLVEQLSERNPEDFNFSNEEFHTLLKLLGSCKDATTNNIISMCDELKEKIFER